MKKEINITDHLKAPPISNSSVYKIREFELEKVTFDDFSVCILDYGSLLALRKSLYVLCCEMTVKISFLIKIKK